LKDPFINSNSHLHKEKEMVDFRKSFLLLALIVVMTGLASAQVTPAFTCVAQAGVPPVARYEGLAEEVGQVVISCTGGKVLTPGQTIPTANFQIFLNTNVTSRLLKSPWTEALLMVDEPAPGDQVVCGPNASGWNSANGTCDVASLGTGAGAYTGIGPDSKPRPSVWQAQLVPGQPNSLVWLGVPVDPPGTSNSRVIRLVNVRADAQQAGLGVGFQVSTITMFISISGTGSLALQNPLQTVAVVQRGLAFDTISGAFDGSKAAPSFKQCVVPSSSCYAFGLRYKELFGTAFRPQIDDSGDQNLIGTIYNTESMFVNSSFPSIAGRGNLATAGVATQATLLMARFNNIPARVKLFVSTTEVVSTGGIEASLISTDSSGLPTGGSPDVAGSDCFEGDRSDVGLSGGNGWAVWRIDASDPNVIGEVWFGVGVTWDAGNPPDVTSTSAVVLGSYAPLSSNRGIISGPAPRFFDDPTSGTAFSIKSCRTNLLFPFVTNQAGFDTGIAISNTSKDPWGTPGQTGACTINYYGPTAAGGDAPKAQTSTAKVAPGCHLVGSISSGEWMILCPSTAAVKSGITATPGFQGYVIASCDFQYAHAYAFISDVGAQRVSEGYLALVMDEGLGTRTPDQSETLEN
jgi:hypothetical protein